MIGIILAGGTGSRLFPLTKIVNKHLLPLYDKPVIYYSIAMLMQLDIYNIIIICNPTDYDLYYTLLSNGENFGSHIQYVIQEKPDGILSGIRRCSDLIHEQNVFCLLGDNFFYGNNFINIVKDAINQNEGATMFCFTKDYDYMITTISFDKKDVPIALERKQNSKNEYISPGMFIYDKNLAEIISNLDVDKEWINVNKFYLNSNLLKVVKLDNNIIWFDVGMFETRMDAEKIIDLKQNTEGVYIGCIEEIALRKEMINKEQLKKNIEKYGENSYKEHLKKILAYS